MRIIKLSAAIFAIGLFLVACTQNQPQQTANVETNANANEVALTEATLDETDYWAKDNLDLQRVGNLLERSNSPQEFEAYLNDDDGINNLDLNGDGYADYISVDEYQDRDDYERGLSIYSRFGPNDLQEIGTVVLYRDDFRSPGARILITGNDQIYGDNYYYETNWLDRALSIASFLFSPRDVYYRSPYYYDNYPDDYDVYEVVGTPFYRSRIERLYPSPVFIYTTSPTFITKIKIKSPNNGLHLGQIRARLVKPTKEQAEFIKNNPSRSKIKADKTDKGDRGQGADKDAKGGKKDDASKPGHEPKDVGKPDETKKGKPSSPGKDDKQTGKEAKSENDGKGQGKGKGKP